MVPPDPSEEVGRPAGIDKVDLVKGASRVVYRRNTIHVEIRDTTCGRGEVLFPWPVRVLK